MSLKWKYLIVVHAAIVTVAALFLILHKLTFRLDPAMFHLVWAAGMAIALSVILLAAYGSFVADPIDRIIDGAERLASGEREHRIEDIGGTDELAHLADAINRMAGRIEASQDQLEAQVAERTADLRAVLEEVHERSRIAEEVNRQLAEVDRRRTQFLTNVSHELRTPLNSILGFVRLLVDGMYENDEEAKEYLENTRLSASHLLHLVTNVLSASQLRQKRLTVKLEPFHPGDVVHDVLRILEVHARDKQVRLRMEIDGRALVLAEEAKVRQILVNLVGNAIKYTDRGEVVVRTREDGAEVAIEVEDTGEGIPAGELERIFERFHQVESPSTRSSGGTGLGLSIARELAELMGGRLRAHSDGPGRGACFTLTLPSGSGAPPADAAAYNHAP